MIHPSMPTAHVSVQTQRLMLGVNTQRKLGTRRISMRVKVGIGSEKKSEGQEMNYKL